MAEVLVSEKLHETFGELYDEAGPVKRRLLKVEKHQTIQGQTIEDLLAGSIAQSDSLDDQDAELKAEVARNQVANAEIIALWERDRQKDIALWAMSLMCQEMELRLQKLEQRFDLVGVGAVEQIAEIMATA